MDSSFCPAQRRLHWYEMSDAEVRQQWDNLPDSQKRAPRSRHHKKLQHVNDIVAGEMKDWLEEASPETLRHYAGFRNPGEIAPYVQEELRRGIGIIYDASRRVEYIMSRYGRDGRLLRSTLDRFRIPYSHDDSTLEMVNELAARWSCEHNLIQQSPDSDSDAAPSRTRPRPYGLRPRPGRASEDQDEQGSESLSAASAPETQEHVTADVPRNPQICNVCDEKEIDSIYYPCGHRFACFECTRGCLDGIRDEFWRLTDFDVPCPVCRQKVTDIVRTYDV